MREREWKFGKDTWLSGQDLSAFGTEVVPVRDEERGHDAV